MTPWPQRQAELANLLNPAYCGFLLRESIVSYAKETRRGMPISLCFLVLPIVLHQPTRSALPRAVTTSLLAWLQSHPEVRIEFALRVNGMSPFTRESMHFLLMRNLVEVDALGAFKTGLGKLNETRGLQTRVAGASPEVAECVTRARFVGRWLALAPDEASIFNFFGIQP
jgi:hypothetical protein